MEKSFRTTLKSHCRYTLGFLMIGVGIFAIVLTLAMTRIAQNREAALARNTEQARRVIDAILWLRHKGSADASFESGGYSWYRSPLLDTLTRDAVSWEFIAEEVVRRDRNSNAMYNAVLERSTADPSVVFAHTSVLNECTGVYYAAVRAEEVCTHGHINSQQGKLMGVFKVTLAPAP